MLAGTNLKHCRKHLVGNKNLIPFQKVNYRNTRNKCEICLKLTIKTPEQMFLLLTLLTSKC